MRIKIERSTGHLCPQHEAFVRFKANQSQMRKYIKKEYMVTERDKSGKISKIVYEYDSLVLSPSHSHVCWKLLVCAIVVTLR